MPRTHEGCAVIDLAFDPSPPGTYSLTLKAGNASATPTTEVS
jgi:hypothetical protein